MKVSLIRKHRQEIMAVAMIWIAIRHSNFPIDNKALNFIFNISGYGGVDIFFFVSSFGLYYAYKKKPDYLSFLKRRFSRVYPYLIPICIILFLLGKRTFQEMLIDASGLSIWLRNDWIYWYTSMLLFMYCLTPLYLKIFKKDPKKVTIGSMVLISLICYLLPSYHYVYMFFRANIFVLGFYFAYLDDNKYEGNLWWLILVMIVGWFMLFYFYHNYGNDIPHVLPFLFITPGLTMFIAWFLDKVTIFNKPLNFIGQYTFQFYLIHEEILRFFYDHYGEWYRPGIHFDFWINFNAIIISFVVAMLYKKLVDYIMNVIIKKQEKV